MNKLIEGYLRDNRKFVLDAGLFLFALVMMCGGLLENNKYVVLGCTGLIAVTLGYIMEKLRDIEKELKRRKVN